MFSIHIVNILLIYICFASDVKKVRKIYPSRNITAVESPILNYGNWCGPGHGGFQDCCLGIPCPACTTPLLGENGYQFSPYCFKQCPPIDAIDLACAWHDACCFVSGTACGRLFDGQQCFCNCVLRSASCAFDPSSRVCNVFRGIDILMDCWSCPTNTGAPLQCHYETSNDEFCGSDRENTWIILQLNSTFNPLFQYFKRKYNSTCHSSNP